MAQAARSSTLSAFVAQLLAPTGELADSADDRRFLRELRQDLADRWQAALHRYYAASALRSYYSHSRNAAALERPRRQTFGGGEERAHLAMIAAVDRMMDIPAPTIGALRHKQKLRGFAGGRDRWEVAIAADTARLGG